MPGFGGSNPEAVVTANRFTTVEFEPATQYLTVRPSWYQKRRASQIARGEKAPLKRRLGTRYEPGAKAWRLVSTLDAITQASLTAYSTSYVTASDLNLATGVQSYEAYRKPSDLTGVSPSGSLVSTGVPTLRRTIADGATWNNGLTRTLPTPPTDSDETEWVPLSRMCSGKVTYPANCGFQVYLFNSLFGGGDSPGPLFELYFGGPQERLPNTEGGGPFCLRVFTDQRVQLWELTKTTGGTDSKLRLEFRCGAEVSSPNSGITWEVLPLGRSFLVIRAKGGGFLLTDVMIDLALLALSGETQQGDVITYRHSKALTGCETTRFLTGPGVVHLDVRRDLRGEVRLARSKFPTTGYVQDLPFLVPWPVIPEGTLLTLKINSETPPGTDVTAQLYDATDDAEITPNDDGDYELAANQGKLYVKFTLTGDGDQTPLLYGYEAEVTGLRETRTPTVVNGGLLREVSITGPDQDPSQSTARATISDLTAQLNSLLLTRSAIHARIKTQHNAAGDTTILHEGLMIDARARYRGRSFKHGMSGVLPRAYPASTWRDYSLTFASMWAKVQRQLNVSLETFAEDTDAEPNALTGDYPPWKITDIITYLFRKAGVPDSQLDIPDLDLRLWPSKSTADDLILQPGQSFAEFLLRLTRDYLGQVLLWDPNASTAGMWRLIANPTSPYTSLATFVGAPTGAGKVVTHPNSYAAATTFIVQDTYESWVVPPEANFIVVTATGELLPADASSKRLVARIYNPLSFNWDPANPTADDEHPDYLGEMVPLLHFDPTLTTPEAVAFVARRLYDRVAHAEKWFSFQAPALYINDENDTELGDNYRPLRINDVITVLGETALVRSANYEWNSDVRQMMTIEGRFLT
jgi:hypothetical protein